MLCPASALTGVAGEDGSRDRLLDRFEVERHRLGEHRRAARFTDGDRDGEQAVLVDRVGLGQLVGDADAADDHHVAFDCELLNAAREQAEPYLDVFRHCKHCRADAFGIPGSQRDLSALLYEGERVEEPFSPG